MKIIYAGIFLDEASDSKLNEVFNQIIETIDWENYRIISHHHMTIAFHTKLTDELKEWCDNHRYESISLVCTEIGISDKAIAVKVNVNAPCANTIKHITLAVNTDNHGKPVDSNNITTWYKLNKFLVVSGNIDYFMQ